jgi:hypothetical protein
MKTRQDIFFCLCVLNGYSAVSGWKVPVGSLVAIASLLLCVVLMAGCPREFFRNRACFYSLVISLMNLIASIIIV